MPDNNSVVLIFQQHLHKAFYSYSFSFKRIKKRCTGLDRVNTEGGAQGSYHLCSKINVLRGLCYCIYTMILKRCLGHFGILSSKQSMLSNDFVFAVQSIVEK